jgi:hypothetical protein
MIPAATPSAFSPLTPKPDFSDVEISNSENSPPVPYYPVALRPATDAELAEVDHFLETLSRAHSHGLVERYMSVLRGDAAYHRAVAT